MVLVDRKGPESLATLMQVLGFLRNEDQYRASLSDLQEWADCYERQLAPLIDSKFLIVEGDEIYSPDLIEWMRPLEEILEARRQGGKLGGRPPKIQDQAIQHNTHTHTNAERETLPNLKVTEGLQCKPSFISSPLLLSSIVFKKGGVGGNPALTEPEPLPQASVPVSQTLPSGTVGQDGVPVIPSAPPKPPNPPLGMVEILPPEPEYQFPGCYLGAIEHDQIRVHTPDHLIRRAALIVRGHWIKNPTKPVKKFSAEITWALVEARKQAAENDLARSKAKRARDGPTPRTNEPIPIGKRRPANAID